MEQPPHPPPSTHSLAIPGASLLGLLTGTFVLGIITVQTVYYSTTFKRDRFINQIAVTFLIFLNYFEIVCVASSVYFVLVCPGPKNPWVLLRLNWRYVVPELTQAAAAAVVTLALTFTIQSLCNCKIFTWALRALILGRFGYVCMIVTQAYMILGSGTFDDMTAGWKYILLATLSLTTDSLTCGGLFVALLRSRTGNEARDAALVRMIRYMAPGCILLLAWESAFSISTFKRSEFGAVYTGLCFGPVFNFIFLSMLHARSKLTYTTGQLETKRTLGFVQKPPNVCTVSIARETVYQTCDHGAQELKLMSRLEARFPEEAEVQSYYAEGPSYPEITLEQRISPTPTK